MLYSTVDAVDALHRSLVVVLLHFAVDELDALHRSLDVLQQSELHVLRRTRCSSSVSCRRAAAV